MGLSPSEASPRLRARLAGGFYVITIVCGIFAEAVARGSLVVSGDAAATARNILASQALFRTGLAADAITLASYIVVTLLLYELLARVNRSLSLLAALFSLVGIATLAVDALTHVAALLLLQGPHFLAAFSSSQLAATALFSLKLHAQGYAVSGVFFGTYCVLIGWLVVRSGFLPRVVGVLMMIAGAAYLIDSFMTFLLPSLRNPILDSITLLGLLGEGSLAGWLLVMGVNETRWSQREETR
jgi:hypothetical protein